MASSVVLPIPPKDRWQITASSGNPRLAINDRYADEWLCTAAPNQWLQIDLGQPADLFGLEYYWGQTCAWSYRTLASLDGETWHTIAETTNGEGGLNLFGVHQERVQFIRFERLPVDSPSDIRLVQINLLDQDSAPITANPEHIRALAGLGAMVRLGDSLTVDFGYERSPLGVLVKYGETYAKKLGVYLSHDGFSWRDVGQITTGNGDYDSFYWRSTSARFVRLTVHEASNLAGATFKEVKLRILNKDKMPIGHLESLAESSTKGFYPFSLLGEQVYWTALGLPDQAEEALFDEYGNIEPIAGRPQIMAHPIVDGHSYYPIGEVKQHLVEGALPMPTATFSAKGAELSISAYAESGNVLAAYKITNTHSATHKIYLSLTIFPMAINPFWQHGGFAAINHAEVNHRDVIINGSLYCRLSQEPTDYKLLDLAADSHSATETVVMRFGYEVDPGKTFTICLAAPMTLEAAPADPTHFVEGWERMERFWRAKVGQRRITTGDQEIDDTVEAQTALILVNATKYALKPGPRNYDRTWIRDGSSQALALAYAGLTEEAARYVRWYAARLYPNGMVPPILNKDGSHNRGYGSDIEFDAQGQFVMIAAEVYRLTRDTVLLDDIYEPVKKSLKFVEDLIARTNAIHGPESRFHGLLAPSISHEGYNKPSYSYWDNYFALGAWHDLAFLAAEKGDSVTESWAREAGNRFASDLERSIRQTAKECEMDVIPGSADREDFDPTSTSIAFEPCQVDGVLPKELIGRTYDRYMEQLKERNVPGWDGNFTPYELRNFNALVALGRFDDAQTLLAAALEWRRPQGFRHWAEVVWGNKRAPEYIGDMPHTWIGAEFATAIRRVLLRERGEVLELFRGMPKSWWSGNGVTLRSLPSHFGQVSLVGTKDATGYKIRAKFDASRAPKIVLINLPGASQATVDDQIITGWDGVFECPPFAELSAK